MEWKPVTVTASTATAPITPLGFHRYASEFLRAARAFDGDEKFSPVPYYLYCRSLELGFKAFLLGKSVSKHEIKTVIGHDLMKALDKANRLELGQFVTVTDAQVAQLDRAHKYYASKGFEYFRVVDAMTGYPDLPDVAILDDLAGALVGNLERYCLDVS